MPTHQQLSTIHPNTMKQYQDTDPLHGHGKAVPHVKRPTSYTYRGGGRSYSVDPIALRDERDAREKARKAEKSYTKKANIDVSIYSAVAAILGFTRSFGRGR